MGRAVEKGVRKYVEKHVGKLCNKMCKKIIRTKNGGKTWFCTKFLDNLHSDLHMVFSPVNLEFSMFYT